MNFFYFIITQIIIIHLRRFFITSDLLCCLSVVALLYTLKFNICCIFCVCSITPLPVLSPPVYIFRIYFKMLKALQASSVKVCFSVSVISSQMVSFPPLWFIRLNFVTC